MILENRKSTYYSTTIGRQGYRIQDRWNWGYGNSLFFLQKLVVNKYLEAYRIASLISFELLSVSLNLKIMNPWQKEKIKFISFMRNHTIPMSKVGAQPSMWLVQVVVRIKAHKFWKAFKFFLNCKIQIHVVQVSGSRWRI